MQGFHIALPLNLCMASNLVNIYSLQHLYSLFTLFSWQYLWNAKNALHRGHSSRRWILRCWQAEVL